MFRILKSKRIRWKGLVARMEAMRNAYKILSGKPEGIGRPRCRWENNIKNGY
jgi:hypothetical protein